MTREEIGNKYRLTADYHTHTTYSKAGPYLHAKGSILDNVRVAHEQGLKELAITDHGPSMLYGLDKKTLPNMREEIEQAKVMYPDVNVLLGVEANIVNTANGLDVKPSEFKDYDFVNAGYHYSAPKCGMITNWISFHIGSGDKLKKKMRAYNTKLALRALNSNKIKVLTHPGDKAFFDMEALAKACEKNGVLVEINARHKNPDADDLRVFAKYDVKFVISSDAHKPYQVGRYVDSLMLAMEAGISIERIVNVTER